MPEFNVHVPLQAVTNPILLWLFAHGWESPSWGHLPINQATLGLILHEVGERVADRAAREQVQAIAREIVAQNAHHLVHQGTAA